MTNPALDDLCAATRALRAAARGTATYPEAVDQLVAVGDRAAARLQAPDLCPQECERLVAEVASALALVTLALTGGSRT